MNLSLKVIIVVILLVPLLAGCGSQESVDTLTKIGWHTHETGIQQAKASKKKMFLYFRADW